jgi:tetratricopeptide (TPR) repeat protein
MKLSFRSIANYMLWRMVALVIFAHNAVGQGNYDIFSVSPQEMFAGVDGASVQRFNDANTAVQQRPNDVNALLTRAGASMDIALKSRYRFQWIHFAAKDLEKAIQLDPNNFYARHDYGMACFLAGDVGGGQPNMQLAVIQLTKAIQLKPDSARSYMGRGWAYLMLNDQARAQADFEKALQLDPSLKNELVSEANAIVQKKGQAAGWMPCCGAWGATSWIATRARASSARPGKATGSTPSAASPSRQRRGRCLPDRAQSGKRKRGTPR